MGEAVLFTDFSNQLSHGHHVVNNENSGVGIKYGVLSPQSFIRGEHWEFV